MRASTQKRVGHLFALAAAGLLIVPLAACSASSGASDSAAGSRASSEYAGSSEAALEDVAAGDSAQMESDGGGETARAEQSLIRTGYVSLEVDDPAAVTKSAADIAERFKGQVASQSVTRADAGEAAGGHVTLRIPADRFDEALEALEEVGEVVSQETSSLDVTAEHVDLQARVKALEASVERLTELMSGSGSTGELIEAETALSQRQQELDGLQAQLDALEDQVDLATIEVSLSTESVIPGGGPTNFWEGLVAGFQSLLSAGAGLLVVLGVLLPWLVVAGIVALVVILIVRRANRRRRERRAAAGAAAPFAAVPVASGTPDAAASTAVAAGSEVHPGAEVHPGVEAPGADAPGAEVPGHGLPLAESPAVPETPIPDAAPGAGWEGNWDRPAS